MGIPDTNAERPAQPGCRPTFDSLLEEDVSKSRSREDFVILPVEIIRLLGLPRESKYFLQVSRSAKRFGFTKRQWSTRKGYLPAEAAQIFEDVARRNDRFYRANQAHWLELEMANAARDLGDETITFSEASQLLGMGYQNQRSTYTIDAFPFGVHPRQELYREWLKQPLASIEDVRKAYDEPDRRTEDQRRARRRWKEH